MWVSRLLRQFGPRAEPSASRSLMCHRVHRAAHPLPYRLECRGRSAEVCQRFGLSYSPGAALAGDLYEEAAERVVQFLDVRQDPHTANRGGGPGARPLSPKPYAALYRAWDATQLLRTSAATYARTADSPTACRTREAYVRGYFGGEFAQCVKRQNRLSG